MVFKAFFREIVTRKSLTKINSTFIVYSTALSIYGIQILKYIAGSPTWRQHRPGTILYQNDSYDVLRSP